MSYVPPGWPVQVLPPSVEGWESSAALFLFDSCPADFRAYEVLRRHPIVLARFASRFVRSQMDASRAGLAEVRADLHGVLEPQTVEAAVAAWQSEHSALARRQREVELVEDALRGRQFVEKL